MKIQYDKNHSFIYLDNKNYYYKQLIEQIFRTNYQSNLHKKKQLLNSTYLLINHDFLKKFLIKRSQSYKTIIKKIIDKVINYFTDNQSQFCKYLFT